MNKMIESIYAGYEYEPDLAGLIGEYQLRKPKLIHGHGRIPPVAVIVGEAPGAREVVDERPFTGPSGQFLRRHLESAGIDPDALWITNAVKYRPRQNRTPDREEIMCSRPYLMKELGVVTQKTPKPVAVLACGRTAATAMLGTPVSVTREMGTVFHDPAAPGQPRMMICWHPAAALRSAQARAEFPEIIASFARLIEGILPDDAKK